MKKTVKNLVLLAMVGVMILGMVGCKSKDPAGENGSNLTPVEKTPVDIIKEKGKLVVGTSADYPPYEHHMMIDGKDQIVGSDIEIAKKIAEALGVELVVEDMGFDGLVVSLNEKKFDLVIAGLAVTEDRKKVIDFSIPYVDREQKVIVKKADVDKYTSLESLKGLSVGAQKGTVQQTVAETQIENAQVVALTKYTDLVLEVQNGKTEAMISDGDIAVSVVAANPDLALASIVIPKSEEDTLAIGIFKGNAELKAIVDEVLQGLIDSKELDTILEAAKKQVNI